MRNKSLDAVKAIAACLVVCIHVSFPGQAGQLVKVLARCAVPFFFMVSGYFCYYQNCNASKRILSKILHIMKLFAVSVVFYFIWECFMKAWNGERVWTWIKGLVSTEHLKEFFVYNSTSPVRAHLWFLPALKPVLHLTNPNEFHSSVESHWIFQTGGQPYQNDH